MGIALKIATTLAALAAPLPARTTPLGKTSCQ